MFAAIEQRTKDIAVLRLLGFQRQEILVSFLLEALLIALIGGLLGSALGYSVNGFSVNASLSTKAVAFAFSVDATSLLIAMAFTIVLESWAGCCRRWRRCASTRWNRCASAHAIGWPKAGCGSEAERPHGLAAEMSARHRPRAIARRARKSHWPRTSNEPARCAGPRPAAPTPPRPLAAGPVRRLRAEKPVRRRGPARDS